MAYLYVYHPMANDQSTVQMTSTLPHSSCWAGVPALTLDTVVHMPCSVLTALSVCANDARELHIWGLERLESSDLGKDAL